MASLTTRPRSASAPLPVATQILSAELKASLEAEIAYLAEALQEQTRDNESLVRRANAAQLELADSLGEIDRLEREMGWTMERIEYLERACDVLRVAWDAGLEMLERAGLMKQYRCMFHARWRL